MPDDASAIVYIVDDDRAVREALALLMRSVGYNVAAFGDAVSFLEKYEDDRPSCLVLDVRMPGVSGLELQDEIVSKGVVLPIIFVSGHADVAMAVRAMRHGAFDFLEKPFNDQVLLDRINECLRHAAEIRGQHLDRQALRSKHDTLTPREREVCERIIRGDLNKVIAADLGISERTVEIHRGRVMEKMQARSLAELVRLTLLLGE